MQYVYTLLGALHMCMYVSVTFPGLFFRAFKINLL